jgi:hypothetical protein
MGDMGPVPLKENLIETRLIVEVAQRRFQALDGIVTAGVIVTLVVDATDLDHGSEVAGLGQKTVLVPEAEKIDL